MRHLPVFVFYETIFGRSSYIYSIRLSDENVDLFTRKIALPSKHQLHQ